MGMETKFDMEITKINVSNKNEGGGGGGAKVWSMTSSQNQNSPIELISHLCVYKM